MSQRQTDHTPGQQSPGWESEERPVPENQVELGTASSPHDKRHVQHQPKALGDPRSTLQAWYPTRDALTTEPTRYSDPTSVHPGLVTAEIYTQPNIAGIEHTEWSERPSQPSGGYHFPKLWEIKSLI